MEIKGIIIDDEQPAREELAFLLSDFPGIQIVDQADSASKAVESIKTHGPDVIFLDIQMPGKSGFDVIPEIKGMNKIPLVIFITAYDQYAVKAFEENAIDYIMKPVSLKRLEKTIKRINETLALKTKESMHETHRDLVETISKIKKIKKISVEHQGRLLLINPSEIMFCQYKNKKITVHTLEKIYTLYGIQTMDQLELNLKSFTFFRSHRNTIVNFDFIKEFSPWFNGKYLITMRDKESTELIVPRKRAKLFKEHLGI